MKKLLIIFFLLIGIAGFSQPPTASKTITNHTTFTGSLTGTWWITDISPTQTRKVGFNTIEAQLIIDSLFPSRASINKLRDSMFAVLNASIALKLNITDTANIRFRPHAGTNITLAGTYPDITFNVAATSYTFSTGLTNSSGTVTSNLSTGISGGQSVIGGTATGDNLTLSSTSNATKGKILFGTSGYDEVNNRLGIGINNPAVPLDIQKATGTGTIANFKSTDGYADIVLNAASANPARIRYDIAGADKFIYGCFDRNSDGSPDFELFAGQTSVFPLFVDGATGNVYMNMTSSADATDKLQVNGSVKVIGKINLDATNTTTGTTGAQTINKAAGTVNFAAAATSLVVTNSFVTTSSIVYCVLRTNDANAVWIKSVVPASGSFTITLNTGPAAEVSCGFIVYN